MISTKAKFKAFPKISDVHQALEEVKTLKPSADLQYDLMMLPSDLFMGVVWTKGKYANISPDNPTIDLIDALGNTLDVEVNYTQIMTLSNLFSKLPIDYTKYPEYSSFTLWGALDIKKGEYHLFAFHVNGKWINPEILKDIKAKGVSVAEVDYTCIKELTEEDLSYKQACWRSKYILGIPQDSFLRQRTDSWFSFTNTKSK